MTPVKGEKEGGLGGKNFEWLCTTEKVLVSPGVWSSADAVCTGVPEMASHSNHTSMLRGWLEAAWEAHVPAGKLRLQAFLVEGPLC